MAIPTEAIFHYLDRLRDSGITNMFGAGPHIVRDFDVTPGQARSVLSEWMRTFSDRHPEAGQ